MLDGAGLLLKVLPSLPSRAKPAQLRLKIRVSRLYSPLSLLLTFSLPLSLLFGYHLVKIIEAGRLAWPFGKRNSWPQTLEQRL